MSDDMVKQAIIDLQELVRCICSPALKDRNLHSPDCRGYDASNVALLSDRIEELEAKLEKALEALKKISSMSCMGTGIALGRMLKSDANAGDPWADELSARVDFAHTTIEELQGNKP